MACRKKLTRSASLVIGCALVAAAGAAVAGTLTADVQVTVKLLTSSGICGAIAGDPTVEVSCHPPGHADTPPAPTASHTGPLLPDAGAVPYQRVASTSVGSLGVAKEPLPIRSVGTKITSWRIVQLDNARYLELTIAW